MSALLVLTAATGESGNVKSGKDIDSFCTPSEVMTLWDINNQRKSIRSAKRVSRYILLIPLLPSTPPADQPSAHSTHKSLQPAATPQLHRHT